MSAGAHPVNAALSAALATRWNINRRGGVRARLHRWRILHWMLLQKLGVSRWVRAPLFFGERMWILTRETISHGLLGFGYAEAALSALMLEVLRPGMRVVDIGAHLGYEALLASILVGEHGRVVSFEPQQDIAVWTARNLSRFAQTRIVVSAVGDACGELDFSQRDLLSSAFSGPSATSTGGRSTRVPLTTLAAALREDERPVDFLKCDVEGGEMAVLRGAQDVLRRDQPVLVLEAEMPSAGGERPRVNEFAEFLAPLGYLGFIFEFDGALRIGRLGDFEPGHANVGFVSPARPEFRFLRRA
jgi:FkbM family methyltransferase